VLSPYESIYSELQSVEQVNYKIVEAFLNKSLPEVADWLFLHQVGYTDPSVFPEFCTLLKAATFKTIGMLISPTLESLQSNILLIALNPVIDEETKIAAINSYMEKLVAQAVRSTKESSPPVFPCVPPRAPPAAAGTKIPPAKKRKRGGLESRSTGRA
jgi:hypothetical protein